ncbi:hypothetical protein F4808DRAFT_423139 [Astrocystis sublimbata]|nr:hypothetical protein F4808DRAFT_423139 [Astrocystis sublimbata]
MAPISLGDEIDEIGRTEAILAEYFEKDDEKRFRMEGAIGGGATGLIWKLKYTLPNPDASITEPISQTIALKIDRRDLVGSEDDTSPGGSSEQNMEGDDDDDMETDDHGEAHRATENEKIWLETLRWSKHIIRAIIPINDPLARESPGIKSHHMDPESWIYLEWLPNGTVARLIDRALQLEIKLPNRILWRFFLCLARMCVAMGWPPEAQEPVTEIVDGPQRHALTHDDMHSENLMFGAFIPNDPDEEHAITPIMVLIDLGSMQKIVGDSDELYEAVYKNLYDIGTTMVELVTLDVGADQKLAFTEDDAVTFRFADRELMTDGGIILPYEGNDPYPGLDPMLRDLICACLGTHYSDRPTAGDLVDTLRSYIRARDGNFYAKHGYTGESDEEIRSTVSQLYFDAF